MANMVLKKTLLLLGIGALAIAAAGSVIFKSDGYDDKVILVQMNEKWKDSYFPAIAATNKKFKEMGLDFKVQAKERDIFEEYGQISQKGVKDRNISDVFLLGFDRYLDYVEQSNIKDVSNEIKEILLQTPEDEEHYGAKVVDNQIETEGENNVVWKTAKLNRENEDFYGMIPSAIESNIWLFDKKVLGIENGKLIGSDFEKVKGKNGIDDHPTLENLTKINHALTTAKEGVSRSFLKTVDGFVGGNVLNAMVNKNQEEILNLTDEKDASLVWLKKGKSPYTKDVNDFDSFFENEKFSDDFKEASQALQNYGLSFGKDILDQMIGQSGDKQLDQKVDELLKDGTIKMELIAPYLLAASMKNMQGPDEHNPRDVDFGIASVTDIAVSKNIPMNLSGFAGGYGWAVKSTIANKTLTDNQDNKVTKSQAAMMFIKEISQPKYAAGLAKDDGKYSAFKQNIEFAYDDLTKPGSPVTDKYVAEAMKEVSKGYTSSPPSVTATPSTALFSIFWETYAPSYRTAMESTVQDEFYKQFVHSWTTKKKTYRWG